MREGTHLQFQDPPDVGWSQGPRSPASRITCLNRAAASTLIDTLCPVVRSSILLWTQSPPENMEYKPRNPTLAASRRSEHT
jgi:hypothetical protein